MHHHAPYGYGGAPQPPPHQPMHAWGAPPGSPGPPPPQQMHDGYIHGGAHAGPHPAAGPPPQWAYPSQQQHVNGHYAAPGHDGYHQPPHMAPHGYGQSPHGYPQQPPPGAYGHPHYPPSPYQAAPPPHYPAQGVSSVTAQQHAMFSPPAGDPGLYSFHDAGSKPPARNHYSAGGYPAPSPANRAHGSYSTGAYPPLPNSAPSGGMYAAPPSSYQRTMMRDRGSCTDGGSASEAGSYRGAPSSAQAAAMATGAAAAGMMRPNPIVHHEDAKGRSEVFKNDGRSDRTDANHQHGGGVIKAYNLGVLFN